MSQQSQCNIVAVFINLSKTESCPTNDPETSPPPVRFICSPRLFVLSGLTKDIQAQRDDSRFDFYVRAPYRENVPRPQPPRASTWATFHTNYATRNRVIERIAQRARQRRVTDIGGRKSIA